MRAAHWHNPLNHRLLAAAPPQSVDELLAEVEAKLSKAGIGRQAKQLAATAQGGAGLRDGAGEDVQERLFQESMALVKAIVKEFGATARVDVEAWQDGRSASSGALAAGGAAHLAAVEAAGPSGTARKRAGQSSQPGRRLSPALDEQPASSWPGSPVGVVSRAGSPALQRAPSPAALMAGLGLARAGGGVGGVECTAPVLIHCDSQAALKLLVNPVVSQRSKHFDVLHHFAWELVARREVRYEYCHTECMIADCLTKAVSEHKFLLCSAGMGCLHSLRAWEYDG
jgi:hypothetical protein